MSYKRKFRLNVIITYYKGFNPINYRNPLLQIFQNIAWLHRLDYASSIEHQFDFDADLQPSETPSEMIDDLVYLRATEHTQISIKELRTLINSLFEKSLLLNFGVDIGYQMQKALIDYPFPRNYLTFLNYPYVEVHKGNQKSLSLFADHVLTILGEEQDANLN